MRHPLRWVHASCTTSIPAQHGNMQAWNQDTMRAYQLNEIRVLQAGTTVMVEKVQGDLTVFRVGKNPTELYALTSDLKKKCRDHNLRIFGG